MRTNKACPLYTGGDGEPGAPEQDSSLTAADIKPVIDDSITETDRSMDLDDTDELVNVEGTKIKLSSKVMKVSMLPLSRVHSFHCISETLCTVSSLEKGKMVGFVNIEGKK